ncbi:DUF5919 domain-containing protein [Streptomyces shaanxiensis]|uniref:DUF5919 domain-containing protein n=1 Tax=Streptomyces shaanxiensis TaxID=653357 RepID=A0ABP7WLS5_9ACTN
MASHQDDDFEALLEKSSLGGPAASRLRERTPLSRARTVRRINELRHQIAHPGDEPDNAVQAARDLLRLLNDLGYGTQGEVPDELRIAARLAEVVADAEAHSSRAGTSPARSQPAAARQTHPVLQNTATLAESREDLVAALTGSSSQIHQTTVEPAVESALVRTMNAVEDMGDDRYADTVAAYPTRTQLLHQFPVADIFGGARRLDAIGIGLNLLVQNFSGRRLVRLAESGCRVRLLFLNPASSAVKRRERELGIKRGELSRAVEMNILHMRRVRSRLCDPGVFEIRLFDETPRITAYLVNGGGSDSLAIVQTYLRRTRGPQTPVLVLRNDTGTARGNEVGESGLFPAYREEFDLMWAESRPVT